MFPLLSLCHHEYKPKKLVHVEGCQKISASFLKKYVFDHPYFGRGIRESSPSYGDESATFPIFVIILEN